MITYFLPDRGIHGGVKVACQFVELLRRLGARAVVALPRGIAPTWFACSAPVVDLNAALNALTPNDWAMLTWPAHYRALKATPARLVNHAQGVTDMDAIFADPQVMILTCWEHSARYLRNNFGREPIEVGISISDGFFPGGEVKIDNRVAFMPRRGREIADACISAARDCEYVAIDARDETDVASILRSAGIFVATSVGEDFGLPALEAMAAGCVVLSVPVKGGMEYLRSGENCLVDEPGALPRKLWWITRPEQAALRRTLRHAAVATAHRYHRNVQARRLAALGRGGLAELFG
jgi:glycosyltransferase involved in cell wall biosynthesis